MTLVVERREIPQVEAYLDGELIAKFYSQGDPRNFGGFTLSYKINNRNSKMNFNGETFTVTENRYLEKNGTMVYKLFRIKKGKAK